jgi:hypothetical protein
LQTVFKPQQSETNPVSQKNKPVVNNFLKVMHKQHIDGNQIVMHKVMHRLLTIWASKKSTIEKRRKRKAHSHTNYI